MKRKYSLTQFLKNVERLRMIAKTAPAVDHASRECSSVPGMELEEHVAAEEEVLECELVPAVDDPQARAQALLDASPPIDLVDPATWQHWRKSNSDWYGNQAVVYAERWARFMQAAIDEGSELKDIAKPCEDLVDLTIPLSLCQYGAALYILSRCWVHGPALDDWAIIQHRHSFRASYVKELLETRGSMAFVDSEARHAFLRRQGEQNVIRAEQWARLMEVMMEDGRPLEQVAHTALRDIGRLDIKSPIKSFDEAYMLGFLVGIWIHGRQLGQHMLPSMVG